MLFLRAKAKDAPASKGPGKLTQARRNLKALNMGECETALYKATTKDSLPPKDKHVLTIVRLAGEEESALQVDTELAKRLRCCRNPVDATVAAKTLLVMHRVLLAGQAAALRESAYELSAVCSEPQGQHDHSEFVSKSAAFLRMMCGWDSVGSLRATDEEGGHAWSSFSLQELAVMLPRLQQLSSSALDCAVLGRSANSALQALRLEIIEDVLCLFRLQVAGASTLITGLLACPSALVDAKPGGARNARDVHGACTPCARSAESSA